MFHGNASHTPRGGSTDPRDACAVIVIVIGRNEGERLRVCFDSLLAATSRIVYVDSGSTDGSVALAASRGIKTVALDLGKPFTAARARNSGFKVARQRWPDARFVQFVDGDCEIAIEWLAAACRHLEAHPNVACVCGRLRERFPERSVYNRLCDAEWARPPGQTAACGGISMMRAEPFESIGGFREDVAAGEEAELCARIRAQGHLIWRLDTPMGLHDAAMYRFGQWWMRCRRTGFGYMNSLVLRLGDDRRADFKRVLRPWLWCVALPSLTGVCVWVWGSPGWLLLLVYPTQILRVSMTVDARWRARFERGLFLMLGKLPELIGQWQFWRSRRSNAASASFDYKT